MGNLRRVPISDGNLAVYAQLDGELIIGSIVKLPGVHGDYEVTQQEFVNTFDLLIKDVKEQFAYSYVKQNNEFSYTVSFNLIWRMIKQLARNKIKRV